MNDHRSQVLARGGEMIEVKKPEGQMRIVRYRILLRNQRRETVLECIASIFVARRPDPNAPTPR